MLNIQELQKIWLAKEKEKIKNGKHKYLHVDQRLGALDEMFVKDIWKPEKVAKHSFYPLALFEEKRFKYKKDVATGRRLKEIKSPRPISYAAHYDSLVYSWYSFILSTEYEDFLQKNGLNKNVIAYRSFPEKKSNLSFVREVTEFINRSHPCGVLNLDIENFFGTLDHSLLKRKWVEIIKSGQLLPIDHYSLYRAVTHFSQFDIEKILKILKINKEDTKGMVRLCTPEQLRKIIKKNVDNLFKVNESEKGIPQGTSISCVLSNIYMLGFDKKVSMKVQDMGGIYRRYSDDIVVVVPIANIKKIEDYILTEINEVKLEVNNDKTERTSIEVEGQKIICKNHDTQRPSSFKYLGIEFDGKNFYLRHKGLARFQTKTSRGIRRIVRRIKNGGGVIPWRSVLDRYSPKGDQNYLIYAKRAQKELHHSQAIKQQTSDYRIYKNINQKMKKNITKFGLKGFKT